MVSSKQILYLAPDSALAATQVLMLERAGFPVHRATSAAEGERLLKRGAYPLVIFGPRFPGDDGERLAKRLRDRHPDRRLLCSGRNAKLRKLVHGQLEAQQAPETLLRLVGSLLMQAHGHPEIESEYVAYVDMERRYTAVSDGVCRLLGYPREELLGMKIDEVTYPETANVPRQFQVFRQAGEQYGAFLLRHRKGGPVPILYRAQVLSDGCMVSVFTPAPEEALAAG